MKGIQVSRVWMDLGKAIFYGIFILGRIHLFAASVLEKF